MKKICLMAAMILFASTGYAGTVVIDAVRLKFNLQRTHPLANTHRVSMEMEVGPLQYEDAPYLWGADEQTGHYKQIPDIWTYIVLPMPVICAIADRYRPGVGRDISVSCNQPYVIIKDAGGKCERGALQSQTILEQQIVVPPEIIDAVRRTVKQVATHQMDHGSINPAELARIVAEMLQYSAELPVQIAACDCSIQQFINQKMQTMMAQKDVVSRLSQYEEQAKETIARLYAENPENMPDMIPADPNGKFNDSMKINSIQVALDQIKMIPRGETPADFLSPEALANIPEHLRNVPLRDYYETKLVEAQAKMTEFARDDRPFGSILIEDDNQVFVMLHWARGEYARATGTQTLMGQPMEHLRNVGYTYLITRGSL